MRREHRRTRRARRRAQRPQVDPGDRRPLPVDDVRPLAAIHPPEPPEGQDPVGEFHKLVDGRRYDFLERVDESGISPKCRSFYRGRCSYHDFMAEVTQRAHDRVDVHDLTILGANTMMVKDLHLARTLAVKATDTINRVCLAAMRMCRKF